ncbi:unnamed protein product [Prunus armeniaca]|uniref:Uncharacterized protein n=1 Tax=Prunus armeniaca TaxID=36596 RepID=A0A6J5TZ43_PRUAR|nr:unnamed protein product [Prunus armeniaca]CAB4299455.1 unnamed protein product [Prunus armeniaca]
MGGGGARDTLSDSDSVSEFDFDSEWASLPLCFFVLDKLLEPIDHARFAAVCKERFVLQKSKIVR